MRRIDALLTASLAAWGCAENKYAIRAGDTPPELNPTYQSREFGDPITEGLDIPPDSVALALRIDEHGVVQKVRVLYCFSSDCDGWARRATKLTFDPALRHGRPIAVWDTIAWAREVMKGKPGAEVPVERLRPASPVH